MLTGDGPCPARTHCHAPAVRLAGAHSASDWAMTAAISGRGRMTVPGSLPGIWPVSIAVTSCSVSLLLLVLGRDRLRRPSRRRAGRAASADGGQHPAGALRGLSSMRGAAHHRAPLARLAWR